MKTTRSSLEDSITSLEEECLKSLDEELILQTSFAVEKLRSWQLNLPQRMQKSFRLLKSSKGTFIPINFSALGSIQLVKILKFSLKISLLEQKLLKDRVTLQKTVSGLETSAKQLFSAMAFPKIEHLQCYFFNRDFD